MKNYGLTTKLVRMMGRRDTNDIIPTSEGKFGIVIIASDSDSFVGFTDHLSIPEYSISERAGTTMSELDLVRLA